MKTKKADKKVDVRISEEELKIIKKNMEKYNIKNLSFFMKTVAKYPSIINVDIEPLVKLNYEINKIGVNINQVIKLANQNSEINQSDINEIKALMSELESLKEISSFLGENNLNGIH